MMYNCIIVDDEFPARELLESYVSKMPQLNLIGKFASPLEAMELMDKVDILFLDIQMPDISGIEFLQTLTSTPQFIFTTAYEKYAVQGFELNATDYLVKPFSFNRFAKATNKAIQNLRLTEPVITSETPSTTQQEEILPIKSDGKIHKVFIKDILYIEGLKAYVSFFTPNGRLIGLYSMKELESKLSRFQFIRVHKSYIVNLNHISSIDHQCINIGQKSIPVGQLYRDSIRQHINWLKD